MYQAESGEVACKVTQVRPLVFLRTNEPLSLFPENYAVRGRLLGSQVRSQSYAQVSITISRYSTRTRTIFPDTPL